MPAVSLAPRAPGLNFAALTFQGGGSHGTWRISRSHLFLSPCATNSNLLLVRKDGRGSESPQGALQSHPLYFGVRPAEPLTSSTHAQLCDLELPYPLCWRGRAKYLINIIAIIIREFGGTGFSNSPRMNSFFFFPLWIVGIWKTTKGNIYNYLEWWNWDDYSLPLFSILKGHIVISDFKKSSS